MLVHIHDRLKISDVQERFSKCFPCLKIEFYNKPHRPEEACDEKNRIDPQKSIEEIRKNHINGVVDIKSWETVDSVEKKFKDKFGLNIQIFRRASEGWRHTAKTAKYTLLQQAEMASYDFNSPTKTTGQSTKQN